MSYCPKCGKENIYNAPVCPSCNCILTSPQPATPPPQAKTSGLAITSLILAILGIFTFCLTALPAIIFGIIALVKIQKSNGLLKGRGLAITGIILPPITVILLMALLIPAFRYTRPVVYRMVCAENMSALGKAMAIYANDNKDKYPASSQWCDLLSTQTDICPKMFQCKGGGQGRCHYAMNKNIEKLGPNSPLDMVLLFETKGGWNQAGGRELLTTENHPGQGCNVLFIDGYVEFVKSEKIPHLRWDVNSNN